MSYENAPATKMLATHCAICSRPLLDAVSVEIGMGPDCRRRHGFEGASAPAVDDDARGKANAIVHAIACGQPAEQLAASINDLRALGFAKLADVLVARKVRVSVRAFDASYYAVKTPFSGEAVEAFRHLPGRRWAKAEKVNLVARGSREALWTLLRRYFRGELLATDSKIVTI